VPTLLINKYLFKILRDDGMSDREIGHVKWFNEKKGFGFIINQAGEDVFVHYKDIQGVGFKTLQEKEEVSYVLDRGPKGLKAHEVMHLEANAEVEEA
jgi:CspA family cold shock protein